VHHKDTKDTKKILKVSGLCVLCAFVVRKCSGGS